MGWSQLLISIASILAIYIATRLFLKYFRRYGITKDVPRQRVIYLEKFISILSFIVGIIVISLIYSIDYKGLLVFASSIFAVVGVALFAQWSILSNITSSLVIFFSFPARIGDVIKIVDKDENIEGEIVEITLFQLEIKDKEGNRIFYPNSLVLQKPIIKRKKEEVNPVSSKAL